MYRMNYLGKTCKVLIALCKEKGIKGYSGKKKDEILDMLKRNETGVHTRSTDDLSKQNPVGLLTEDTGKIFEMAICLANDTPYDGRYKYSMEKAEQLKQRVSVVFDTVKYIHTAKKGARYDFTSTDHTKHLSAKSTKKGGKVAPQVIGQAQPRKFCDIMGVPYTTNAELKQYIQTDIVHILPVLASYTFDCPILYYNEQKDTIRYITYIQPIQWEQYQFRWTCHWNEWSNSSTLKIMVEDSEFALVEFQIHSKKRTNMAIRWFYENVLTVFKPNLAVMDV
jgi:hypothetical protein